MEETEQQREDRHRQEAIRARALRSIAVLEKSFIHRASGRYFRLLADSPVTG